MSEGARAEVQVGCARIRRYESIGENPTRSTAGGYEAEPSYWAAGGDFHPRSSAVMRMTFGMGEDKASREEDGEQ